MNELMMLVGFFVFWVVLQRYILPRLGVQT